MAADIDPVLLAIAGDVRARTLLAEAVGDAVADRVEILDSGDAEGITDGLLRLVADVHARFQVAAIERVRAARGQGSAVEGPSRGHPARPRRRG